MRHTIAILVVVSLAISAGYAKRGRGNGQGKMRWAQELNLSESQMKEIYEFRKNRKDGREDRREEMMKLHQELQTAIQKDDKSKAYDDTLKKLHNAILEKRSSNANKRFGMMLKLRKILTSEQLKKFRGMKRHRGQGKRMGRGKGKGKGRFGNNMNDSR